MPLQHNIKILPIIKTWKKVTRQLWILINELKIKLCWFQNSQYSVTTVKPGTKDTVLENMCQSKWQSSDGCYLCSI